MSLKELSYPANRRLLELASLHSVPQTYSSWNRHINSRLFQPSNRLDAFLEVSLENAGGFSPYNVKHSTDAERKCHVRRGDWISCRPRQWNTQCGRKYSRYRWPRFEKIATIIKMRNPIGAENVGRSVQPNSITATTKRPSRTPDGDSPSVRRDTG